MQIKITDEQVEKLLDCYGEDKEGFAYRDYENKDYRRMKSGLITIVMYNGYLRINVNIKVFLKWRIEIIQEDGEVGLEIPTLKLIRGSKYEPNMEYTEFQETLQKLSYGIYQIEQLLEVIK